MELGQAGVARLGVAWAVSTLKQEAVMEQAMATMTTRQEVAEATVGESTVVFYGASDDLIEVDGTIPGCDEYNGQNAEFEICGLRVEVDYMVNGVWGIRVHQVDESVPVTARSLELVAPEPGGFSAAALAGVAPPYPPYSMRLVMRVPAGAHVTKVG